ncbi:type VI secretion system tube protein TssD [uncultured Spirosoma sp.]|uniref:type VI secretion system tube protein TssD n=1 Tax=uncultured Spirosoma sp. TaxID=278208 RepID=UPI0025890328|nr:type VI secretion system tube protein TssD [uncultured Spirosoma sp.]
MPYSSKIKLGADEYDILGGDIGFTRSVDVKGRPSSHVMGGQFSFTVEVTDKSSLVEHMVNAQNKPFDKGSLEFTDAGDDGVTRKFEFTNAYIVNYSESFSVAGNAYTCSLTISAETIKIQNALLDQRWPKKS